MKPQETRPQSVQRDDWLKVASGENTPENRAKWPNYRNRGGAGPCEVCGEDSPWFTCGSCGSMTCKAHHAATFRYSYPIEYCIKCKPAKFKKLTVKPDKPGSQTPK